MATGEPQDSVEERERQRIDAAEVSWALRRLTRSAVDVDFVLARRMGLRPMDYTALGHVLADSGSLSPRQLSERLGISSGSTSELIDRLENIGHVERLRSTDDRRRISLAPTTSSIDTVLSELAPLLAELDRIAEDYSPAERALIEGYLRRASRAMDEFQREEPTEDR